MDGGQTDGHEDGRPETRGHCFEGQQALKEQSCEAGSDITVQ